MTTERSESGRIVSLDQFRGYTVLGMFWVNFIGGYLATPWIFKHHHTFCSYADTIMPQFFFAVGFSYRLALLKRLGTVGSKAAYGHFFKRALGLMLLGFVVYHFDGGFKTWSQAKEWAANFTSGDWEAGFRTAYAVIRRDYFQTLVHIGVTTLWVMPVMGRSAGVRVLFALVCGLVYTGLSMKFYYDSINFNPRGIDGGPLGFLTWTIPTVAGSLAYDWMAVAQTGGRGAAISKLLVWGLLLMCVGYGVSCLNRIVPPTTEFEQRTAAGWDKSPQAELARKVSVEMPAEWLVEPPFIPPSRPHNMWSMSLRSGSLSLLTFGAGLSLFVYAFFVIVCDIWKLRLGLFTTLGANALAGYVIHMMVDDAIKPWVPRDAPWWYVFTAFIIFFAICYIFLRYLEKHKLYLRL
jgi:predicted acyltransferase